jgi:hypothetical protein
MSIEVFDKPVAHSIGHSLFAALRQNRVLNKILGRSFIFAPKAQK